MLLSQEGQASNLLLVEYRYLFLKQKILRMILSKERFLKEVSKMYFGVCLINNFVTQQTLDICPKQRDTLQKF